MNSFDWHTKSAFLSGAQGAAKPDDSYYYPGGQIGGPVRLPFTDWNRKSPKMFFFAGFEY